MVDDVKRLPPPSSGPNPLPIETVRDLLGIVRVLYAFQRSKGNHGYAKELERAGQELRRALAIAIRRGDTAAHAEAWRLADDAIVRISWAQDSQDDLTAAVKLAADRVSARQYPAADREAKRAARIKRG